MLTDTLTAVANRRHLDERLKEELARLHRYGQPLAVILTDIDWFKQVNDNHGHAVGDKVLKAFAASLHQNIRSTDFLARYGGEEFVILLPNTGFDEAIALAERMRKAIKALRFEGYDFTITASFGVVLCGPQESAETIISRADQAMYKSKTRGRDRVTAFDG
jgi:diguanylate cyclase (GGDEF)-like protein